MPHTTLLFLRKDDQVLLAMKKRSFGEGKWNGVGGKIMEGETPSSAAVRETQEEIGVLVAENELRKVAELTFEYADKPEWNQMCTVFICTMWEGVPSESEEMDPKWFSAGALPYEKMWIDDPYWLPQMLAGKQLTARFSFTEKGNTLMRHEVKEVENLS